MKNTIANELASVTPGMSQAFLKRVMFAIGDRMSSQTLISAGLQDDAGTTDVETSATCYYIANGVIRIIASGVTMPTLVGTVLADQFNVFAFYANSAGVVTVKMGTEGASLATVVFPIPVVKAAMLGFVVINPTGTGNFIGGTDDIDDATIVPTSAYVNTLGASDPTILLGPTE